MVTMMMTSKKKHIIFMSFFYTRCFTRRKINKNYCNKIQLFKKKVCQKMFVNVNINYLSSASVKVSRHIFQRKKKKRFPIPNPKSNLQ